MSDKPISVGDLVCVVKPPNMHCACAEDEDTGKIYRAIGMRDASKFKVWTCNICGVSGPLSNPIYVFGEGLRNKYWGVCITRLKRIPPLSELESEKRDEEITA